MNTEKVFTAFNNDGEEILLYRKDNDTFIDLNSDNNYVYPKKYIDLSSLSLISNTLELRKHMLKSCIKRKYKKDREKLLDTKKFLVGQKLIITNYEHWYTGTNIYNMVKHHRWEYKNSGFDLYKHKETIEVHYDTIVDEYINLCNKIFYGWKVENEPENIHHIPNFKNGEEYILIVNNLFDLTKQTYLDKKTINETAHKLRKKY